MRSTRCHMRKMTVLAVALGAAGLVVGYLIFGRIAGEYLSIGTLFRSADNLLESAFQSVTGLKEARQNILISGAAGVVVGLVVGGVVSRRG